MAAPPRPRRPTPDRLLKAALDLAAERRWRAISLADIAAEAKVSLAQLHEVFPDKAAILAALAERADAAMLAGSEEAAGEPVRERLMDALMRRLDSFAKDKRAVASILRDAGGGPVAALCAGPRLLHSMRWCLEAAGLSSAGIAGALRARALAAIYLSTVFVWLRDDSADQGRTMAHLDRSLRRAERLATCRPGLRRGAASGEEAEAPA